MKRLFLLTIVAASVVACNNSATNDPNDADTTLNTLDNTTDNSGTDGGMGNGGLGTDTAMMRDSTRMTDSISSGTGGSVTP